MVGSLLICFVLALVVTDSQHVSTDDTLLHDNDMLENLKAGEHTWKHLKVKPRRNRAAILKGLSSFHLPIRLDALIETQPCNHHIKEIF